MNCTMDNPCGEWEGKCNDLENHLDCQEGLRCGKDICKNNKEEEWNVYNCCFKAQGNIILSSNIS